MGDPKKRRKSGLTTLQLHLLEQACQPVWTGFGSGTAGSTYLVGTAQTGGKYRDVDVRTILPDDEFDALFGGEDRNGQALWSLLCFAIGRMLADQTGLPIDYQIQRMSEANEKYKGERNPVGHGRRVYAGGGDATAFKVPGDASAKIERGRAATSADDGTDHPRGPSELSHPTLDGAAPPVASDASGPKLFAEGQSNRTEQLRHSWTAMAMADGVPLDQIVHDGGWCDARMPTTVYAHGQEAPEKAAAHRIESLVMSL